jgi:hypothetical protein
VHVAATTSSRGLRGVAARREHRPLRHPTGPGSHRRPRTADRRSVVAAASRMLEVAGELRPNPAYAGRQEEP